MSVSARSLLAALILMLGGKGEAMPQNEVPPSPGPVPLARLLAGAGIRAATPEASPLAPVTLESARPDWKRLTADRACHTLTPLRIGAKTYRKGLGAHANGAAVFRLNGDFARFVADVGIDNNPDTAGTRGSVEFVVKVDGREAARTPVCRGGESARRVEASLRGAQRLELIVTDAGDGYSYDQADWADARLLDTQGRAVYLSDVLRASQDLPFPIPARLPASFVYGGEPSEKLLADWPREEKPPVSGDGCTVYEVTWREPGNGLAATWRATLYEDLPAMEFRWTFRNAGSRPAKPLTRVLALDLEAAVPPDTARLIHSSGGLLGGLTAPDLGFAVTETRPGSATLSGAGGRSSNKDLPFFLLHADDDAGGLFVGVGWSGQWQAQAGYTGAGSPMRLTVEMPGMNLALPPGETLISPSVLLGLYSGEAENGGNALRRALRTHYTPLLNGAKPLPPVSWNSWFVLTNAITEELLRREADIAAGLGIEYFCIDAGWFEGDFPDGVGNWTLQRAKFPQGLKPIGDYARAKGMKLGLWFEPERVAPGTRLAREHPEWVHGDLLDLGLPEAREWVFQMMKGYLDEGGVEWIRFDFNTDPLAAWERMDTPETRGLAQARHIAGLYALLDRLRAAYPGLLIEGCASGGRRIDLETIRRSHTFWKSDETGSLPVMRFHETGGNRFLPGRLLNANLLTIGSEYDVRSLFGGPLGFGADWTRLSAAQLAMTRRLIAEYKEYRPLLDGDYYPLFPQAREETGWIGWQFHDPATGEGVAIMLRPEGSAYSAAQIRLRGLEPDRRYRLRRSDRRAESGGSGRQLMDGLTVSLPRPGSSLVLRYRAGGEPAR